MRKAISNLKPCKNGGIRKPITGPLVGIKHENHTNNEKGRQIVEVTLKCDHVVVWPLWRFRLLKPKNLFHNEHWTDGRRIHCPVCPDPAEVHRGESYRPKRASHQKEDDGGKV